MNKGIIIALILSIVTPLILSYLFLELLTGIEWTRLDGGVPQILAILSFASIGFGTNIPIFGFSYLIPFFIWIMTGLFVGLFTKSVKKRCDPSSFRALYPNLTLCNSDFHESRFHSRSSRDYG